MRIIVVLVGDMYKFPPVLSLINALNEKEVETVVISTEPSGDYNEAFPSIRFDILPLNYENNISPFKKMMNLPRVSDCLWERIERYYNDNSIIWAITDVTLKHLGNKLTKKKYVLH